MHIIPKMESGRGRGHPPTMYPTQSTQRTEDPMEDELTGSELGRRLAAQRLIVEGTCVVCGTTFQGTRKRKFCSHKCTQMDYWRRKRNIHSSLPADNPYMLPEDRAMDKVILLPDTAPSPQASSAPAPESKEEAS